MQSGICALLLQPIIDTIITFFRSIGEIQFEIGLYLKEERATRSLPNQQFSVHDENDKPLGNIVANGYYFIADELKRALGELGRNSQKIKDKEGQDE